ncbi:MAG: N-acetylneuraminate synthase family protein [Planctomycetota bacterium]|jgi:sialic acid synthase SpsE
MRTVKIGRRAVGAGRPVYVIAEAGSNHNRSLRVARKLIDAAAAAGADAVKFQTFSAEALYSKKTPKMRYLKEITPASQSVYAVLKGLELPRRWHAPLAAHCRKRGVDFLSTPFDEAAVDQLAAVGVPAYKIASFEINHIPLIRRAARAGKPMILSTGMADLADIRLALEACRGAGNRKVILMHCAIGYPPRFEDINLRAMVTMQREFGLPTGYSDHSRGHVATVAAVALGACCVEKHFTLSRRMKGPDHGYALEPGELAEMVAAVRNAGASMGSAVKKCSAAERELHRLARRSLVAARDIPRGHKVTRADLAVKRPGFGIQPVEIGSLVGSTALRDVAEDDVLLWKMFRKGGGGRSPRRKK